MAKRYSILWGTPVPNSLTVQMKSGRSYQKIPKDIFVEIAADLAKKCLVIERVKGAYVFYKEIRDCPFV